MGCGSDGATATYGSSDDCTATSAFFDACDPVLALEEYGRLYNGHAIIDSRGVCPVGWGVPSDEEWMELELTLGLSLAQASQTGDRGSDEGGMLKSSYGWLNDSYGATQVVSTASLAEGGLIQENFCWLGKIVIGGRLQRTAVKLFGLDV